MKTHTHTPGPWVARQIGGSHVSIEKTSDGIRSVIAETYYAKLADEHGGGYSANAQLIAAAPELLQALKELCADKYLADPINADRMKNARAAICKAEGRA